MYFARVLALFQDEYDAEVNFSSISHLEQFLTFQAQIIDQQKGQVASPVGRKNRMRAHEPLI
jgi:hypothetical protein